MPLIRFTGNLQRHVDCPPCEVLGDTVRHVLEAVFERNERVRGYVLDDAGGLRKHMTIFVDGQLIRDRSGLSDSVGPDAKIDVMQALSGG